MLDQIVTINRALTGDWEKDKKIVKEMAETPMTAATAYMHACVIKTLFNQRTFGTPSAPGYPNRVGLLRKVYDELFPIAYFAKHYFHESSDVVICWHDGNQQYDATVEDQRQTKDIPNIRYLEVTTLQDNTDADLLLDLAINGSVRIEGDHEKSEHQRKLDFLKKALNKKAGIAYPPGTVLLVYTDEDRYQKISFDSNSSHEIDRRSSFKAILEGMQCQLTGFSAVFVYCKSEIYCSLIVSKE